MTAKATNKAGQDDSDDGVLRIGDTPEEPKYDALFRLHGKPYEGLVNPPASLMLRYMDTLRKRGSNVAVSWLLEQMLKADAYAVLTTDPAVSRAEWQQVCDLVLGLVFGKPDPLPKSSRNG